MSCQQFPIEAGDYVDGDLTGATLTSFEAHLPACAACAAAVADFQAIRSMARALDPELPTPQLYGRIAAAIAAEPRPSWLQRLLGVGAGVSVWRPACAVATLLAVLVGSTWLAGRQVAAGGNRPIAVGISSIGSSVSSGATGSQADGPAESDVQLAEGHYRTAISSLEQITRSDSAALDGPTTAVLQANLTVIDRAIGESRAALQQEPSSDLAQESLFDALRSKLALLQDIVSLINEMRKGNQEGAARIVSGLNQ